MGAQADNQQAELLDRPLIWAENAQYPAVPVSLLGLNFLPQLRNL